MYFGIIFFIVAAINSWLVRIVIENIFVAITVLITTFVFYLIIFRKKQSSIYLIIFSVFFLGLVVIQIKTSLPITTFEISSLQKDLQQTRMNEYPPKLSKLSYLIDGKKESIMFFKLVDNFFEPLDFTTYFFQERFAYVYLPFFFIGLFNLIKKYKKVFLIPIFISLFVLTIVGNNSPFDQICLYPIFIISILSGLKYMMSYGKKIT